MEHIRFPTIPAKDLILVVQPTGFIDREMYLKALEYQICPELERFDKSLSMFQLRLPSLKRTFTYQSDFDTNGILYWLGTHEGTKPYENPSKIGKVVLKSCEWILPDIHPIVDWNKNEQSYSKVHEKEPWVEIHFTKYRIIPSYYTLRADLNSSNGYTFRNWVFEGSCNGGNTWVTLRTHIDDKSMAVRPFASSSWDIDKTKSPNFGFQALRIRRTGPNGRTEISKNASGADTSYMTMQGLEIYGDCVSDT